MSIKYFGNTEIKEEINKLLEEMEKDEELAYTIHIYESRENEKISKLLIEVSNIENSMLNF